MASESKFSISLPDDLRCEVDDYATLTRRSRAVIIKEAVPAYVGDQQAYLASVREAEREADEGTFVLGETVADWLASRGTDSELQPPKQVPPRHDATHPSPRRPLSRRAPHNYCR